LLFIGYSPISYLVGVAEDVELTRLLCIYARPPRDSYELHVFKTFDKFFPILVGAVVYY
jgi:hypothetical protein